MQSAFLYRYDRIYMIVFVISLTARFMIGGSVDHGERRGYEWYTSQLPPPFFGSSVRCHDRYLRSGGSSGDGEDQIQHDNHRTDDGTGGYLTGG